MILPRQCNHNHARFAVGDNVWRARDMLLPDYDRPSFVVSSVRALEDGFQEIRLWAHSAYWPAELYVLARRRDEVQPRGD